MGGQTELTGPRLDQDGVLAAEVADGSMLTGQAFGEAVLLVRRGTDFFALGASCTHYGAPLADGILVGNEVRCPWHHACFDIETGAAKAPALSPLPRFAVERRGERVFVVGKSDERALPVVPSRSPSSVVVLGAGAAGLCAAEALRRGGYEGPITMIGQGDAPVDRPNLSKDYLAGTAPEEWIPLRAKETYAENRIDLVLGHPATAIDTASKTVVVEGAPPIPFDALLVATGAAPVKLSVPGHDLAHVHTLRTLADSRAMIAAVTGGAKRAVVIGASFIGLEVAASLRARGVEVDVVAPEPIPLERILGPELGKFVQKVHASHGVRFHLGSTVTAIAANEVTLSTGEKLACDLVAVGVGVRPETALAEAAGLVTDKGIVVDEHLRTSVPGVFAAGDVARYLDARTGKRQRVEHWVHAGRQGQAAAASILGSARPYATPPFFWSVHYDVTINYVGHAERWDAITIAGSIEGKDCLVAYHDAGAITAVATIGRDQACLRAEVALERGDAAALEALARG